ncbi:USP6 N-terminal-like protein isoform X6 [Canis lupus familiaris]|uniref:USP6 N-terminal-like protein isoform X6 n=1 Tax=Canis lupus familiaris TaxID=9615 RepID=UPI0018F3E088|nr:USP6 N-terminal-like protein isoform X6 [Canis lupus familiaris]
MQKEEALTQQQVTARRDTRWPAHPPPSLRRPRGWETSLPSISTMQEDPETLLTLQRANIVAQYHQGFLQDKELPGPSPREAKKLRQETRHVDKWIKMLKRWDHYLPSEKLRLRVYKGVPPHVRGQVWL